MIFWDIGRWIDFERNFDRLLFTPLCSPVSVPQTSYRSLQLITHPQALSKKDKKNAKLRTFVSVSYSSTQQLPMVLPVLSADNTHDCIRSSCPLQEDSNLELPGTVKEIVSLLYANGYKENIWTLLLLQGGQGTSGCSEVGSKVYMQAIIHAEVWMVLHRRQQVGKGKI